MQVIDISRKSRQNSPAGITFPANLPVAYPARRRDRAPGSGPDRLLVLPGNSE
jgi:hypothetical protein